MMLECICYFQDVAIETHQLQRHWNSHACAASDAAGVRKEDLKQNNQNYQSFQRQIFRIGQSPAEHSRVRFTSFKIMSNTSCESDNLVWLHDELHYWISSLHVLDHQPLHAFGSNLSIVKEILVSKASFNQSPWATTSHSCVVNTTLSVPSLLLASSVPESPCSSIGQEIVTVTIFATIFETRRTLCGFPRDADNSAVLHNVCLVFQISLNDLVCFKIVSSRLTSRSFTLASTHRSWFSKPKRSWWSPLSKNRGRHQNILGPFWAQKP